MMGKCVDKLLYNNPKHPYTKAMSNPTPLAKSRPRAAYGEEQDIFKLERLVSHCYYMHMKCACVRNEFWAIQ